jgi:hypothetical protein
MQSPGGEILRRGDARYPFWATTFSIFASENKHHCQHRPSSSILSNNFMKTKDLIHLGVPDGGVLATENAVIPCAVGVEIAFRMKLTVHDRKADTLIRHSSLCGTGAQVCDVYSRRTMARRSNLPKELKHLAWLTLDEADGQEFQRHPQRHGRTIRPRRSVGPLRSETR